MAYWVNPEVFAVYSSRIGSFPSALSVLSSSSLSPVFLSAGGNFKSTCWVLMMIGKAGRRATLLHRLISDTPAKKTKNKAILTGLYASGFIWYNSNTHVYYLTESGREVIDLMHRDFRKWYRKGLNTAFLNDDGI